MCHAQVSAGGRGGSIKSRQSGACGCDSRKALSKCAFSSCRKVAEVLLALPGRGVQFHGCGTGEPAAEGARSTV